MLKKIVLHNFRNFSQKTFEFEDGLNLIHAKNASGKTNILEAIYLFSSAKSFKAQREEEMINYDRDVANIAAFIDSGIVLDITLTRGVINMETNMFKKVSKKKLMVNKVSRRMVDFCDNFKATVFLPEDLDLVTSSPSQRRNFLDRCLSSSDRHYRSCLLSYEKGLRHRNKILLKIRDENLGRNALLFWDELLIKNADYISQKRQEFIDFVNNRGNFFVEEFSIKYDKSVISKGRLEQYKDAEVASGNTLVGPHRDDFVFYKDIQKQMRELNLYGSRGEQRMGVLWLKIKEINYMESILGEKPVLLLDDIFSELDNEHRKIVFEVINGYQTIITSADDLTDINLNNINLIRL